MSKNYQSIVDWEFESGVLLKFGKLRHLEEMLERGRIRFAGAKSYGEAILTLAQQDNELEVEVFADAAEIRVQKVNERTLEPTSDINPIGQVSFALESLSDYYISCMTSAFDPRFFNDFGADAFLLITDPHRFVERIFSAFGPIARGWTGKATFVNYYDPQTAKVPKNVFFEKNIRYEYQKEYRIAFRPPQITPLLESFFLDIGSLADYCEIIVSEALNIEET